MKHNDIATNFCYLVQTKKNTKSKGTVFSTYWILWLTRSLLQRRAAHSTYQCSRAASFFTVYQRTKVKFTASAARTAIIYVIPARYDLERGL